MKTILALILIHGWYDQSCCGGKDCHPVPCEQIIQDAHGDFNWRRGPNDFVFFLKNKMHPSQDEDCHVCVLKDVSPAGVCIYLPPRV